MMRRALLSLAFLPLAIAARAQSYVIGDAFITGRLTTGTTVAGASLDVKMSSSATAAFQVSGVDETPFFVVTSTGNVGMGVTPEARLDLTGTADVDNAALVLRNGNLYPATTQYQMTFGENGTVNRRHAIRSIHLSSTASNGIDFLLWTPSQNAAAVGSLGVMSIVTTTGGASMHVRPVGTPIVDLVVSDGSTLGAGAVHRAAEVAPSSREWKTDISSLETSQENLASLNVEGLKHVTFRYKKWTPKGLAKDRRQALRRGLIYEEAPASAQGPGKSLILDERIVELELAMKQLIHRVEAAEKEAAQ
ncbi:MAG: tail fiber domain-containing protein [Elusimicrobia bacterium]|nr:tail fiber domain-containing protein [Elusimicrobiota bacterium]